MLAAAEHEVPIMTADELLDRYGESRADDWVFWVYVCEDGRPGACSRAVHREERRIGLAWSPARDEEVFHLPARTTAVFDEDCTYHWVELLYDGVTVERQLAAWLEEERVSLPVPSPGPRSRTGQQLRVSRRAWQLVRLANRVDPDCGDFDDVFAESGLEVR